MSKKSGKQLHSVETPGFALRWPAAWIAAAAALGYLYTLSYNFVFDDTYQVLLNTWIRSWSNAGRFFLHNVWAFWNTKIPSGYYRPMHMILYTAGYTLGGLHPSVYHALNIAIHVLCSILVYLIAVRITERRSMAMAGGLLFALHPVHVESVAWISGVTDPLCALFYFAALYFHLKTRNEDTRGQLWTALLFLAALFSKEMAFTFPIAALWLDFCLKRKIKAFRYGMLAGAFGFYALMRIVALGSFLVAHNKVPLSLAGQVLSRIVLTAEYIAKAFVPYHINPFHVFEPTTSASDPRFLLSLAFLAAVGGAAWMLKKQPSALFLLGFTGIAIAPVLNITGIGENVFADRYLYIPTLGSCLLIPLLASLIPARFPSFRQTASRFGWPLLGLALIGFGWRLQAESSLWKDDETLFRETLQRSPNSATVANSLAVYYLNAKDLAGARECAAKAYQAWNKAYIKSPTTLVQTYAISGEICLAENDLDCAQKYRAKIKETEPASDVLLIPLATYHVRRKEYEEALSYFDQEIRLNPEGADTHSSAAGICILLGRYDDAIAYARSAIRLAPESPDGWRNLASALAMTGKNEEAIRALETLKKVDPAAAKDADAQIYRLEMRREGTRP
jgi:tetratricopeptide (TPR) repeat protein